MDTKLEARRYTDRNFGPTSQGKLITRKELRIVVIIFVRELQESYVLGK